MYNIVPETHDYDYDNENPNEQSKPTREGFDMFRAECEELSKSFYKITGVNHED